MAPLPLVVLFTCVEYGQSNMNLAISFELALAGVDVCIVSFAPLESRVASLQELISQHAGVTPAGSVSFREIKGLTSYWDVIGKQGMNFATIPHPPGFWGALSTYPQTATAIYPWDEEEHLTGIQGAKDIIMSTQPDIVVVDVLLLPVIDACKLMGQKFAVTYPNSIKELAANLQSRLGIFLTYPAVASGFPFPLSWWQIPLNAYLMLRLIIHMFTSTRATRVQAMRRGLGIHTADALTIYPGVPYICPALPETDFSFPVIPKELVPCGPIVMPFAPLEQADPELKIWLEKGPTVIIYLGSHVASDPRVTREMAGALRILLDHHDRKGTHIQVLWKIKARGNVRTAIEDIIGEEMRRERIKTVDWIKAEPASILEHPNVICTVHHGGANSFFEGVRSGLPHVVLPVWYDTYEYAQRVEFLNLGLYASKRCAPGVRADEFGEALVRVTGDTDEANKFRAAAKALRETCRQRGEGRKRASIAILKEMGVVH